MSRRCWKRLSSVFVIALAGMLASFAQAADFSAERITEYLLLITGPSGNTLVAEDSDGLILIEGVPPQLADAYLAFVRETSGQDRIKTLVHSHWHPESAGLNASLAGDTDIIVQANTRQWLAATIRKRGEEILHRPVPKAQLPTTTFHDTLSLPFRGGSIELGHLLQAHTDGDLYAYFPAQDVLFTGPAVRSDGWAVVDESTNGWMGGLMDALDQLSALVTEDTRIVPVSGPVLDQRGFASQNTMYKALMAEMVALLRKSLSAEEVVSKDPATALMPAWGDASAFLDQGFRSFYGHLRDARHVGAMP